MSLGNRNKWEHGWETGPSCGAPERRHRERNSAGPCPAHLRYQVCPPPRSKLASLNSENLSDLHPTREGGSTRRSMTMAGMKGRHVRPCVCAASSRRLKPGRLGV